MLKRVLPLVAVLFVACGDGGEQFENFCVGVDCGSHGRCAVGAEGAICICDSGFTLQDGACKEALADDPCKDVMCEGNGTCAVAHEKTAVCLCRPGYQSDGAKCVKDDAVAESRCDGVTCGGHGSCIVTSLDKALCICDAGYRLSDATTCTAIDDGGGEPDSPCKDVLCSNHGTCVVSGSGEAVCICYEGYRLTDATTCTAIDDGGGEPDSPCKDVLCSNHGTCVVSGSGEAVCICYEGYRLTDATTCTAIDDGGGEPDSPCKDVLCSNYGTCLVSGSGAAFCICEDGYRPSTDLTCDAVENPCSGVMCGGFGTCVVAASGEAVCICYEGYRLSDATTCTAIDDGGGEPESPCKDVLCSNHGTCLVSGSGAAFCICEDGYRPSADLTCDAVENPCSGVLCSNHGTCIVSGSGAAFCICEYGYRPSADLTCVAVESPCSGVTCSGHGTCVLRGFNEALCICEDGYRNFGNYCLQVNECVVTGANCSNDWCLIPACTFEMGSPDDEPCRWDLEGPVHSVTITRPFYMKQTEVTQDEWRTLIGNNPSHFGGCGDDCPVEMVSWYDAVYYANKLSETYGFEQCYTITDPAGVPGTGNYTATVAFEGLDCEGYRLPTEAEWEYAARAGTKTAYWIGSNVTDGGQAVCSWNDDNAGILLPEAAWYRYNSGLTTHPVGQKADNPFGLYDVYGNVWEWVYDYWSDSYDSFCAEGCEDPLGPPIGFITVVRGGSWDGDARRVRSAVRGNFTPDYRVETLGFRLARSAP